MIGRYQLQQVIGVGSFATAHLAYDPLLEDTVVIKVLAENHSLNPEIRERFIAEGRSLRRVASPHVVTVHDIGETTRKQPYLVLHYAERGTLSQRVHELRQHGWRATPKEILSVARPLAMALDAVHAAHLVHRDLSPGNLLLASDPDVGPHRTTDDDARVVAPGERLLVADLGMCKDLALNSGLTVGGGTLGFRPPEQDQPGLVDTRADIWAASAVLQWLAQDSDLPARFHEVLTQGMQPQPAHRHHTISQWLAAVEESLEMPLPSPHEMATEMVEHPHTPGTMPSGTHPSTQILPTRRRVRTLLWVGLAVIAVVLASGMGYLIGHAEPEPLSDWENTSLAITGPDDMTVGQTSVFTAEVEGATSWVWDLPTGTHLADTTEASLTATTPGTTELILRTRIPGGPELEVRHPVRVHPE